MAEQVFLVPGPSKAEFDSLSDQMAETEITSSCTFEENITGTNTRIYVKSGIVFIFYQGENKAHSSDTLLFTLPSGYRPSNLIYCTYMINNTAFGNISIATTGKVTMGQLSSGSSTGRIYFATSFPI